MMRLTMTVNQMGGAAAGAILLRTLLQGLDHRGVIGQAKIVIAAEIEAAPAVDDHFGTLRRTGNMPGTVKVLLAALQQLRRELLIKAGDHDWKL